MIALAPDTPQIRESLYPFTATRPSWDLRIGILTIREKWECLMGLQFHITPEGGLAPAGYTGNRVLQVIPGNQLPSRHLFQCLLEGKTPRAEKILEYPWQIFQWNDEELRADFELLTAQKPSAPIPESVAAIDPEKVFIEPDARLHHCTINASGGPVYIGKNSEIMEGAHIRGPFALGEGSTVKMGALIYGGTTIGPHCLAGGEIKNSVIMGYSNKAHEGYLGDSVIGEWCNLGAGTTVSNLRNTAGEVHVWWNGEKRFIPAGSKCGLLMGDYSRSAIHTSFNTGTTTGVCVHLFGHGLTPKFIGDFSWGMDGTTCYEWEKALRDITNWKQLKSKALEPDEIRKLKGIFDARWA